MYSALSDLQLSRLSYVRTALDLQQNPTNMQLLQQLEKRKALNLQARKITDFMWAIHEPSKPIPTIRISL